MKVDLKLKSDPKAQRLIGLSRRAGKLSYGSDGCTADLKKHKSKLIITASDISDKSKKEIEFHLGKTSIAYTDMTKEELGGLIGIGQTVVLSVTDENFSKGILEVNTLYGKSN